MLKIKRKQIKTLNKMIDEEFEKLSVAMCTSLSWYILNTATFNSGHDKSPEFDYPYLWDFIGIHDIYWLGFVQRIHPPNFTPVGVIPVTILHLKSQNPTGFC